MSTPATGEVALVARVPAADVPAVGVTVVASVGGVGSQALTETAGLETVRAPAVAVGLCEERAVTEGVVAGVGGSRAEAGAETAAPPAVPGDGRLVAAGGRQGGTVGPLVLARSLRSEWRVSGARDWGAGESDHGPADSTHPHTSPQSDEAVLPPAGTPGVLDQPELLALLHPEAHHSDGVVGGVVSAAPEYSPAVVLT